MTLPRSKLTCRTCEARQPPYDFVRLPSAGTMPSPVREGCPLLPWPLRARCPATEALPQGAHGGGPEDRIATRVRHGPRVWRGRGPRLHAAEVVWLSEVPGLGEFCCSHEAARQSTVASGCHSSHSAGCAGLQGWGLLTRVSAEETASRTGPPASRTGEVLCQNKMRRVPLPGYRINKYLVRTL